MIAFAIVFMLAATAGLAIVARRHEVTIPAGSVGVSSSEVVVGPGTAHVFGEMKIYDLTEYHCTLNLQPTRQRVSWRPDPENIRALLAAGGDEGVKQRLEDILSADPATPPTELERSFGIKFVKAPEVAEDSDPDDIEAAVKKLIRETERTANGVMDLVTARNTIMDDPDFKALPLYEQDRIMRMFTNAIEDLLAKR